MTGGTIRILHAKEHFSRQISYKIKLNHVWRIILFLSDKKVQVIKVNTLVRSRQTFSYGDRKKNDEGLASQGRKANKKIVLTIYV